MYDSPQEHDPSLSGLPPDAGVNGSTANSASEPVGVQDNPAPSGSEASHKLLEELTALLTQAKPLIEGLAKLIMAHGKLVLFIVGEQLRLFLARQLVFWLGLLMVVTAWVFLSMFLWSIAISLSHQPAAGPLVLLLTHGLAGWGLLAWRERLKL